MTFDCMKPFATRDGRNPVVLGAYDDGHVEGILDGVEFCWNADGRLHVGGDSQADLVNVDPTSPPDTEARSDASDDAAFVERMNELLAPMTKAISSDDYIRAIETMRDGVKYRLGARRNPAPEPDGRTGIYIASKTKHAARWRRMRDVFGFPIVSTWIDEAGPGESSDLTDLWRRCISEAAHASVLIVYREPEDVLKGAWAEMGAALACGVPVLAVGIDGDFSIAKASGVKHFQTMCDATQEAKKLCARALPQPAGAEPVAWQWEQTRDDVHMWHPTTTRTRESAVRAAEAHLQDGARVRPLYAAPPAPAQPTSEMVEGDALGGSRSSTECQRLFSLMWNHVLTLPREKRRAWIEPMGVVRRGRFLTEAEKLARLEDALRDVPGENDEDAAAPPVSAQVASEVVDAARMVLDLWDIKEIIHKGAIAHYFLSALRAALARSSSAGATGSAEDMRERATQVADQRRLECRDRAEEYTPHSHYWLGRASEAALIAEISRSLPLTPPKPDATRAREGR